jgi:hypothetical protein
MNIGSIQSEEKPQVTLPISNPAKSGLRIQLANLVAAILALSFFLPWINIVFGGISGFMLGKQNGWAKIVWAIPIFASITIVAGLSGTKQRLPGFLAAVTPFAFLIYGLIEFGLEFFQGLAVGAWLSLASAVIVFITTRKA